MHSKTSVSTYAFLVTASTVIGAMLLWQHFHGFPRNSLALPLLLAVPAGILPGGVCLAKAPSSPRDERSRAADPQGAVDVARAPLRVDALEPDEFLGGFGMRLLRPSTYDILAGMIRDGLRDQGEFQLTRAQELQREREGYNALEIRDGKRHDFGVPLEFVHSLVKSSQPGS